jgi:pyruvate/2-oxoglutarate dehydrogenase complex dihydrolipoamide dehydrogenase (E3) component
LSEVLKPDLCVIGAGSAGLSVAAIGASLGASVVLIERARMGGDCLNVGCVPSKALIAAGDRMQAVRGAAAFGIGRGRSEPFVHFGRVRSHIQEVIAKIAPNDSVSRYTAMGVRVIEADARFTDARTVMAGNATIQARRVVIATGSRPAPPPIPGLADIPYLTNETVFDLAERPGHLVVVGGGPIGVEIAQAHRRLGTAVTILEAAPRLLARDDPEMAAVTERALMEDGVAIQAGAVIEGVQRSESGVAVALRQGDVTRILDGSHLLVAAGRRPVTGGLGLELAGIAVDGSGIVVDRGLKTTNRRVYAIGDCAGGEGAGYRFTHVANYHAGLVVRNALFRLPVRIDAGAVPRVTYTDPELASVGLSEEEARAKHRNIRILRWPVSENDRAQAERDTRGHAKVIVTPRGHILGVAIAAPRAGDLIVPWCLCMAKGLKVQDMAGLVFPYPTYSEISKRVAVEHLRASAGNPWLKRVMGLMRLFG